MNCRGGKLPQPQLFLEIDGFDGEVVATDWQLSPITLFWTEA